MKNRMNLYASYKAYQTQKKSAGSGLIMFSIILVLGLIIGALGLRLTFERNILREQNSKLQSYLDNAIASNAYERIMSQQQKTDSITKVLDIVGEGKVILDEKQHLTMEILDTFYVMLPEGLQISSSNFALPGVTLQLAYKDQKIVQDYIRSLEKLEMIQAIVSEYVTNTDGSLNSTLVITLRGSY